MAQQLQWQLGTVVDLRQETPQVKSLMLEVPEWTPHLAGQHVDVRLTAEDGYQAQRSYSIASPPDDHYVMLTVERIEDGEVAPYLTLNCASATASSCVDRSAAILCGILATGSMQARRFFSSRAAAASCR